LSIVGQVNVESRRYSGWEDPRYPIGFWQASLQVTGDGTGGFLAIDLIFQQANGGARVNSQMYSVERFAASGSEATNRVVQLRSSNMGGPAPTSFQQRYALLLEDAGATIGSASRPDSQAICPWFLGSQRLAGITTGISLLTANIDTITFEFEAEGYRWSPRSVLVDGGPQRPPTGLYRS